MPRHRLLADGRLAWASGATPAGDPAWPVRAGDTVAVVIDLTGWLGAEALDNVAWDASPGVALSAEAQTGTEVSCHAAAPAGSHAVEARVTADSGRVRQVKIWLRAA